MKKTFALLLVTLTVLLANLLSPVAATATPAETHAAVATRATCNYYDNPGTWPLCEFWSNPVRIPRFDVQGPRPDLTPSSSQWCQKTYIGVYSQSVGYGYIYWKNWKTIKYDIRFWPDYYERLYSLMYWNGSGWSWANRGPITVYCGT